MSTDPCAPLHARLEALEIQVAFADDLLDELNLTVYRQQQMLDQLLREVQLLRQQVPESAGAAARNAHDELPPHY